MENKNNSNKKIKNWHFKAFIYSLDAFIALIIITFIISTLISFSGFTALNEPVIYQLKILSLDAYNINAYTITNKLSSINCDTINNAIPKKYNFKMTCLTAEGGVEEAEKKKNADIGLVKDNYLIINYVKEDYLYKPDPFCSQKNTTANIGRVVLNYTTIEIGV